MNQRLKIAAACLLLLGTGGLVGWVAGARTDHRATMVPQASSAPGTAMSALATMAGTHHGPAANAAPAAAGVDPQTGKKVLYWHDPMVPGQRFDKPGKSPFMDMQLVPVYAQDDDGGGDGVVIDGRVAQNLGIRTVEVKAGPLGAVLETPGNVAIDERSVYVMQARTAGFVRHVGVRATLDPVRRGQALVTLYAPDWVAAQEEYLAVAQLPAAARGELENGARQRMLLAGMTPAQVDAVVRSGRMLPDQAVVSPTDGVVTEIAVREGMTVTPGTPLFRLADLGQVWIVAQVPETQIGAVAPGQSVSVTASALSQPSAGKVDAILPDIDAATRTVKVRIVLPNRQHRLLPGMFATVRFAGTDRPDALLVPSEAIIRTGQRNVVMVDAGKRGYVATEIHTGREAAGMTEVLSGLQAGQKVVASGQFLVDSEASLRGTSARLEAPADPPRDAAQAGERP
ncbi:Cu(I)/Ag(I) efflux system membrane protein CusB/SilB [Cupriavidus sp. H19C3]|uniref:efflux RND transporter periplasmic adaptor subunit n=1 Tax=Cupriavidus sp. H19C3 TaxID=3241603 RepID=UPI003BF865BF